MLLSSVYFRVPMGQLLQTAYQSARVGRADSRAGNCPEVRCCKMTESPTATILGFAHVIRAVIRLPLGSRTRFVIAVADLDGRLVA
jgi:hypothetical protein